MNFNELYLLVENAAGKPAIMLLPFDWDGTAEEAFYTILYARFAKQQKAAGIDPLATVPAAFHKKITESIKKQEEFLKAISVVRKPTDAEKARIFKGIIAVKERNAYLGKILDNLKAVYVGPNRTVMTPLGAVPVGTDTFAVDGRGNILINLGYAGTLTDEQLIGVLAHEAMHIMLLHHQRIKGRTPFHFVNIATDAFINNMLSEDGFKLPPGGVEGRSGYLRISALYLENVVSEITIAKPRLIDLQLKLTGENWESLFETLVKQLTIPEEARKLREFTVGEVIYDPKDKRYGKVVYTSYHPKGEIYIEELTPQEALIAAKEYAVARKLI